MKMTNLDQDEVLIENIEIAGHTQVITLRSYRPVVGGSILPVVLFFHGGSFTSGSVGEADVTATYIALGTPAWVISVGYSLAPKFPFPNATEDGYLALLWASANARDRRADPQRIGLAGHDAGGNIATCVAAIARDRGQIKINAQVLLAPLLDPSMTRIAEGVKGKNDLDLQACADSYRAYLPSAMQRIHPYAAPLESCRLSGLPPALIASVHNDQMRIEAERYAAELIDVGVPTEVTRYRDTSRAGLSENLMVLADVNAFLKKRLKSNSRNMKMTT